MHDLQLVKCLSYGSRSVGVIQTFNPTPAVSNHISGFQLDIKKSIPLPFLPAFHFRDVPVYRHTPSYTIGIETFVQIRDLNP